MKQKEFVSESQVYKIYKPLIDRLKNEHKETLPYNTGHMIVDYNPITPFKLPRLPIHRKKK